MNVCAWITLITGLWVVIMTFMLVTENKMSTLLFKVIPFLLGMSCIGVSLKLFNIIIINI
jgi:hypothetical protein